MMILYVKDHDATHHYTRWLSSQISVHIKHSLLCGSLLVSVSQTTLRPQASCVYCSLGVGRLADQRQYITGSVCVLLCKAEWAERSVRVVLTGINKVLRHVLLVPSCTFPWSDPYYPIRCCRLQGFNQTKLNQS